MRLRQISDRSEALTDADKKKLQESVARAYAQLRTIAPPNYAWQTPPGKIDDWPGKLLGWLLTALATSLGAQFWFNIMSESLKLRSAGRKPVDDPEKARRQGKTERPSFMSEGAVRDDMKLKMATGEHVARRCQAKPQLRREFSHARFRLDTHFRLTLFYSQ